MPTSLPDQGRRRVLLATAGAALLGAPLASRAAGTPDLSKLTLRIGTYKGNWRTLLAAAQLTDTPYTIDWRELNNGVLHIEAINGDALDLGSGSEIPAVFAARQKAHVRFIAVVREDLNNQVTLARRDSAIRTIAYLRGKRVGYVRATTAHYFLQKQLAQAGLSFQDINAVNLTPADGLSAFDRGDLDAWAIYGYNGQLARTRHGARVIKTGKGYLSGNFPIYANPTSIAEPARHAAITDYLPSPRSACSTARPMWHRCGTAASTPHCARSPTTRPDHRRARARRPRIRTHTYSQTRVTLLALRYGDENTLDRCARRGRTGPGCRGAAAGGAAPARARRAAGR